MAGAQLPPFGVIQAALRKTTEHLARELHAPGGLAPAWNDFEWAMARAAASMQGISVLLANRLGWRGPADWQAFLTDQRALAIRREVHILRTLERLDAVTAGNGLPCVALKGAALQAFGLYAPGERPMADIDVLIRSADRARIAAILQQLHYRPDYSSRRHDVFERENQDTPLHAGEHPDNPLKIETHTRIAECLPARLVDITADLFPEDMRGGLNPYRDRVALLRHLLLHAAGNMRANALRQIQLHDISRLATVLSSTDWETLVRSPAASAGVWWALPPLMLVERYYAGTIPDFVLDAIGRECPRVLRATAARTSITQISWSNLRIHAFPGITWARSPIEALRFVASRVWPERRAIDELAAVKKIHPPTDRLRWYEEPHARRIARWLVSRPPRVQTMLSVCAALGIEP